MAIADDRQRLMPTAEDRSTGQPLAYPEAVLITHPSNPELQGEVPFLLFSKTLFIFFIKKLILILKVIFFFIIMLFLIRL